MLYVQIMVYRKKHTIRYAPLVQRLRKNWYYFTNK
jgi:hypothetical protein